MPEASQRLDVIERIRRLDNVFTNLVGEPEDEDSAFRRATTRVERADDHALYEMRVALDSSQYLCKISYECWDVVLFEGIVVRFINPRMWQRPEERSPGRGHLHSDLLDKISAGLNWVACIIDPVLQKTSNYLYYSRTYTESSEQGSRLQFEFEGLEEWSIKPYRKALDVIDAALSQMQQMGGPIGKYSTTVQLLAVPAIGKALPPN